jgi:hypothetical protein
MHTCPPYILQIKLCSCSRPSKPSSLLLNLYLNSSKSCDRLCFGSICTLCWFSPQWNDEAGTNSRCPYPPTLEISTHFHIMPVSRVVCYVHKTSCLSKGLSRCFKTRRRFSQAGHTTLHLICGLENGLQRMLPQGEFPERLFFLVFSLL